MKPKVGMKQSESYHLNPISNSLVRLKLTTEEFSSREFTF